MYGPPLPPLKLPRETDDGLKDVCTVSTKFLWLFKCLRVLVARESLRVYEDVVSGMEEHAFERRDLAVHDLFSRPVVVGGWFTG